MPIPSFPHNPISISNAHCGSIFYPHNCLATSYFWPNSLMAFRFYDFSFFSSLPPSRSPSFSISLLFPNSPFPILPFPSFFIQTLCAPIPPIWTSAAASRSIPPFPIGAFFVIYSIQSAKLTEPFASINNTKCDEKRPFPRRRPFCPFPKIAAISSSSSVLPSFSSLPLYSFTFYSTFYCPIPHQFSIPIRPSRQFIQTPSSSLPSFILRFPFFADRRTKKKGGRGAAGCVEFERTTSRALLNSLGCWLVGWLAHPEKGEADRWNGNLGKIENDAIHRRSKFGLKNTKKYDLLLGPFFWPILVAQQGDNQFGKAICHLKALNAL
jgi:hypothetical protein